MEWISCEDRLPEIGEQVWTIDAPYWNKTIAPVSCRRVFKEEPSSEWRWDFNNPENRKLILITHWMPIPDPPKRGGDDEKI